MFSFILGFLLFSVTIFNPVVISRTSSSIFKKYIPRFIINTPNFITDNKYLLFLSRLGYFLFRFPQLLNFYYEKRCSKKINKKISNFIICTLGIQINYLLFCVISSLIFPFLGIEIISFFLNILQGEEFRLYDLLYNLFKVLFDKDTWTILFGWRILIYICLNFYYLMSTYDSLEKIEQINLPIDEDKGFNFKLKFVDLMASVSIKLEIKNKIFVLKCINITTLLCCLFPIYLILSWFSFQFIGNSLNYFSLLSISIGSISYVTSAAPVHVVRIAVSCVNQLIQSRDISNMSSSKVFGKKSE